MLVLENSPLARREGQPIPDSYEAAVERFYCQAYRVTMSGSCCATTFNVVRETKAENRDACIGCPAGAARAELTGLLKSLECRVLNKDGTPCARPVESGKRYCSQHRLHSKSIESAKFGRKPKVDWESTDILNRMRTTPVVKLALELDVSVSSVRKYCTKKGIKPPKKEKE